MSVKLPINHPDISITIDIPDTLRNIHYYKCIELKTVNFIKIEFLDEGCSIPRTSFFEINNNELFKHMSYFWSKTLSNL